MQWAGRGQEWWWWKSIWVLQAQLKAVVRQLFGTRCPQLQATPPPLLRLCLDGPPVNEPTRITPTARRSPVTSPSGRPPTRCRSVRPSISTHFLNSTPSIFERFSLTTGLALLCAQEEVMDFDGELTQLNTLGYDTIQRRRLVVLFSRIKLPG